MSAKLMCVDRMSGEKFAVDADGDIRDQIEAYIRDGIDGDTGAVAYDVRCDDGSAYEGEVEAG